MTQVFANGEQATELDTDPAALAKPGLIPAQPSGHDRTPALNHAVVPGKGVRQIRCVGCSRDTLPRNDDGAPLCQRCSELLAQEELGTLAALAAPLVSRRPRWRRRTALS